MKLLIRLLSAVVFVTTLLPLHAQQASVPQGINYQSVARNSSGQILTNQRISLKLTIHDSVSTGAAVYTETHAVQTNAFGTFSVVIGGGSIITGSFPTINWGINAKFLQVEMDFNGGTNYTNMGTSQLMSVPYALYANGSAGDVSNIKYDSTGILNITSANGNTVVSTTGSWLTGGNAGLNSVNNYIGTSDNTDFILKRGGKEGIRLTEGGALLATGDTTTGVTPASGPGKRMEWIPAKGAFREGTVTGTQWDNSNIGSGSTALGNDAMASGANTVAIGNTASAIGANAIAMGNGVIAKAANSTVLGTYNDTTASGSGSIGSDVLFQVGNGTATSRSNALTVTKDGQVQMESMVLKNDTVGGPLLPVLTGTINLSPQNKAFMQVYTGATLGVVTFNLQRGNTVGQMITVECIGSGLLGTLLQSTYGMTLKDNRNTSTSNFILNGAQTFNMKHLDMITFAWDGNYWTEISRSVNH